MNKVEKKDLGDWRSNLFHMCHLLQGLAAQNKAEKNTRRNCRIWVQLGPDDVDHMWIICGLVELISF